TVPITTTKNITRNVTIDGGNNITLNAGGARRNFTVARGVTLELRDLTLDSGFAAEVDRAILNHGTLVANNVHITHVIATSHGGRIQSSVTLDDTRCESNYNPATLHGGANEKEGELLIYDAALAKNTARLRGGGIMVNPGQTV